jgi:ribosomal protein S18 acetylase RimI-like enzyme
MSLTYFKRFRMELDLRRRRLPLVSVPEGYRLVSWSPSQVENHAEAKYHSFRNEIDSMLFECLGDLDGCRELMEEISDKDGFLPEATWLMEYIATPHKREMCGTIQGVRANLRSASIQNVGVTPFHRGRGIGTALVLAALHGFQQLNISNIYLEVTAQNQVAVRVYEQLGFRRVKTLYKAVELAYS